ncbi:hypothetical protein [Sunxiuqinia elliptica]|uniref:hypothetical protein n=1 Tax=Sunxiuqinia elliptica TaxID=655355 RepID=UPI000B845D5A|nr:hypothetical protein [Sunxiuqinia elliptica]
MIGGSGEELSFSAWLTRSFLLKGWSALILLVPFLIQGEKELSLKNLAHACLSAILQLHSYTSNHFYLNILNALPRADAFAPLGREEVVGVLWSVVGGR